MVSSGGKERFENIIMLADRWLIYVFMCVCVFVCGWMTKIRQCVCEYECVFECMCEYYAKCNIRQVSIFAPWQF